MNFALLFSVGYKPLLFAVQKHLGLLGGDSADVTSASAAIAKPTSLPEIAAASCPKNVRAKPSAAEAPKLTEMAVAVAEKRRLPLKVSASANSVLKLSSGQRSNSADAFHVDVVNPMTPTKSPAESTCALM